VLLGYNTNGFAHHRLSDALNVLAEIGYRSVALTLDHCHLDPHDRRLWARTRLTRRQLRRLGLTCTVETGARFLLDPHRKHQPTLLSSDECAGQQRRMLFIERAIEIAAELEAPVVSLWSGAADDDFDEAALLMRLCSALDGLLGVAQRAGVRLALEPEPGMFIDTMASFARVMSAIDHPALGLTLDVGHLMCLDDGNIAAHVRLWRERLWNVHIEDMRRGVHDHLMFGEGEIDFAAVFDALRAVDYAGPVNVELSRHSYDAVRVAQQAFEFLSER